MQISGSNIEQQLRELILKIIPRTNIQSIEANSSGWLDVHVRNPMNENWAVMIKEAIPRDQRSEQGGYLKLQVGISEEGMRQLLWVASKLGIEPSNPQQPFSPPYQQPYPQQYQQPQPAAAPQPQGFVPAVQQHHQPYPQPQQYQPPQPQYHQPPQHPSVPVPAAPQQVMHQQQYQQPQQPVAQQQYQPQQAAVPQPPVAGGYAQQQYQQPQQPVAQPQQASGYLQPQYQQPQYQQPQAPSASKQVLSMMQQLKWDTTALYISDRNEGNSSVDGYLFQAVVGTSGDVALKEIYKRLVGSGYQVTIGNYFDSFGSQYNWLNVGQTVRMGSGAFPYMVLRQDGKLHDAAAVLSYLLSPSYVQPQSAPAANVQHQHIPQIEYGLTNVWLDANKESDECKKQIVRNYLHFRHQGADENNIIAFHKGSNEWMANTTPAQFELDGRKWMSAEHYYQYKKFDIELSRIQTDSLGLAQPQLELLKEAVAIFIDRYPNEVFRLATGKGARGKYNLSTILANLAEDNSLFINNQQLQPQVRELAKKIQEIFDRYNTGYDKGLNKLLELAGIQKMGVAEKANLMQEANLAKYTQNSGLGEALKRTGDRLIVEAAPEDSIFGAAPGKFPGVGSAGFNVQGIILANVRNALQQKTMTVPEITDEQIGVPKHSTGGSSGLGAPAVTPVPPAPSIVAPTGSPAKRAKSGGINIISETLIDRHDGSQAIDKITVSGATEDDLNVILKQFIWDQSLDASQSHYSLETNTNGTVTIQVQSRDFQAAYLALQGLLTSGGVHDQILEDIKKLRSAVNPIELVYKHATDYAAKEFQVTVSKGSYAGKPYISFLDTLNNTFPRTHIANKYVQSLNQNPHVILVEQNQGNHAHKVTPTDAGYSQISQNKLGFVAKPEYWHNPQIIAQVDAICEELAKIAVKNPAEVQQVITHTELLLSGTMTVADYKQKADALKIGRNRGMKILAGLMIGLGALIAAAGVTLVATGVFAPAGLVAVGAGAKIGIIAGAAVSGVAVSGAGSFLLYKNRNNLPTLAKKLAEEAEKVTPSGSVVVSP